MKRLIYLLVITLFTGCNSKTPVSTQPSVVDDSTKIANSSLTFYNWYLNSLKNDSTYGNVQINYHWEDTIPILDISKYLNELKKMENVSEFFIESEITRFQICQDSLNTIDYREVESCGCSVGEFYNECGFLNYYFWINSNEKYNGCEIKNVYISKQKAICQLQFFYGTGNNVSKSYDENLICLVNLVKHEGNWLIESIDRSFK